MTYVENSCQACNKVYTSAYNLKKHLKRQPLCETWINLNPGIKDYIDDKFRLRMNDEDEATINTKCFVCNTIFSNVGNLNKHLETNIPCGKWALYKSLEPLQPYYAKQKVCNQSFDIYNNAVKLETFEHDQVDVTNESFCAPKYNLCHIIWNVFLIDKEFTKLPNFHEIIIKENKIKHIIGILPEEKPDTHNALIRVCNLTNIDFSIMTYNGHDTFLDTSTFDAQCKTIEMHRKQRNNVFVFCNNGYQRSIPFLCYYLTKHHGDEIPTIERAIDTILPQADKANYATMRNKYIESITELFIANNIH